VCGTALKNSNNSHKRAKLGMSSVDQPSGAQFCSACGAALTVPGASNDEASLKRVVHDGASESKAVEDFTAQDTFPPGTVLGQRNRYQVVSTLGKGGFGQAYLAHDTHLNRYCVIKRQVINPKWSARVQRMVSQNFQREAQLLVTLNSPGHPNIPEIYEYLAESRCLVMKYIEGRDLHQILVERQGRLSEAEALTYMRETCSALVYMHSREPEPVLHRDIKPSNILIDTSGRVWVVDFGLSKATPTQVDNQRKDVTQGVGTLGYSPAEQWRRMATPRSDVYALAATLHTLLTGYQPQFTNADLPQILRGRKGHFPPVRELNQAVRPDVEQLILRGMAFDMSERPTAQEFLSELESLLAPVGARLDIQAPDGTKLGTEQDLAVWCEQHWQQAAVWLYDHDTLPGQIERIWGQNRLAYDIRETIQHHIRDQDAGLDAVLDLLDPHGFGTEKPRLSADYSKLTFGSLATDERSERTLTLTNTGRRYVRAYFRMPRWLTTSMPMITLLPGQHITVTLTATARRVPRGGKVRDIVLIDDGRHLLRRIHIQVKVTRWRTFWLWIRGAMRSEVWKQINTLPSKGGPVWSVAFSPDRRFLAIGSADTMIRLWRVGDVKMVQTLKGHNDTVMSLAFHPNGQTLVSSGADSTIHVWAVDSGERVQTLSDHASTIWSMAFSPDGRVLASGSGDNTIKLWRTEDYSLLRTLTRHNESALSVAFSPDGQVLATGCGDSKIRLWRVSDGVLLQTLSGHRFTVWSVAFSPDGQLLASSSGDGTIHLWQLPEGVLLQKFTERSGSIHSVAFSPDGYLASGSTDGKVTLWNLEDGMPQQILEAHHQNIQKIVFSADGEMLAAASLDETTSVWQVGYARS
jgi:WD40 repeat protein/tRNA A-37 threonylcarbamoyl transferase component Bud32